MLMRDLVDTALADVYGQAQTVDTTTYLAAPLAADGLSVSVVDAARFSRGIVQVDDELMLIDHVDRQAGTLRLSYVTGRGIRGGEPADHLPGALVVMAPAIPRYRAIEAVASTIRSSSGLYGVGSITFPFIATQSSYELPDEVDDVLSVSWEPSGPTKEWLASRQWNFDRFNRNLVMGGQTEPGRTVRVDYSMIPIVPDQDEDFSITGLPESCADVISLGAAWRMTSFLEPMSLLARSAEAEAMDRMKTPQSRLRVAQYFLGMYQTRLAEEVGNLHRRYPVRVHFSARW